MANQSKKKPTSNDVARLAGVSQATVSLILNGSVKADFSEETRQRVFDAAEELSYRLPVRKNAKKRSSRLLLVLIPTLTNQFYSELVQTLEQYADTLGYRMLVCNTFRKQELEKYYLDLFMREQISGVVYTFLPSSPELMNQLARRIPVVLIGEKREELPICSIELSNHKAGALLANHLYDYGHRHITFISTPMDQLTLARSQRLNSLRRRMQERGQQDGEAVSVELLVASDLREQDSAPGGVPYEYHVGRSLTRAFLQQPGSSTALVGANDMIALGICAALQERGYRLPEDFSVCGFDNIFYASIVNPGLTTIDHCLWARCRSAIDLIVSQDDDAAPNRAVPMADKIEYVPQLIARASTGPAPERASNP